MDLQNILFLKLDWDDLKLLVSIGPPQKQMQIPPGERLFLQTTVQIQWPEKNKE